MLRLRHIVSTASASIVGGGLQLALTIFVARLVPPDQNGHYSQFVVVFNLVYFALNLGLGPASTYFIASNRANVGEVLRVNLVASALAGLLLAAVAWLGVTTGYLGTLGVLMKIPSSIIILALAAGFFYLLFTQAQAMLMGLHHYDAANLLNVARAALALAAAGIAAPFVAHDATRVALAHTLSFGALLAISGALLTSSIRKAPTDAPSAALQSLAGSMVGYGMLVYASNLIHYLAMRGLLLLLSYYSSSASVGFLGMALLLLEVALLIPSAIGQLVFPQSSDQRFDHRMLEAVLRINVLASVIVAVVVVALGVPLVRLVVGPAYAPVALVLSHLAPSIVLLAIPRILSQILSGKGHPQYPLAAAVISLAAGFVVAVLVIPRWGVVGAAWVTNLVSAITALVTLLGYRRLHRVSFATLLLPRMADWDQILLLLRRRSEAGS